MKTSHVLNARQKAVERIYVEVLEELEVDGKGLNETAAAVVLALVVQSAGMGFDAAVEMLGQD